MIGRTPRHRTFADDIEPGGLNVFIPGALASGFLVSIGLLVSDAVRRVRGNAASVRGVNLTAAVLAEEVRSGSGAARRVGTGLRSRSVYTLVSGIALGIALAAIPGATWNFFNPVGYISDISSIWAISLLLVVPLVVVGIAAIRLVPESASTVALVISATIVVRFIFGREPDIVRVAVAVSAAAIGAAVVALTRRWRTRRNEVDVPPVTRLLLRVTPLGTWEGPIDGAHRHQRDPDRLSQRGLIGKAQL
jgi:hypothetical protein